jgi:NAD(P)-dependent dehydrogenase (short-subunit alcohol dehydrogenase family)
MEKNILITGANGNLGSFVVEKLANAGHQIIAVARKHLKNPGIGNIHYFTADLADNDQVKKLVDDVYVHFDTIDGVVCTAGGFAMGDFKKTGKDELDQMFAINFHTAYYLVRHVLDRMLHQPDGGRFIFIGAKAALDHGLAKNTIAYSLSKSLLFQLSGLINEAGKGKNIVSCVIAPGIIDTEDNRKAMPDADPSQWVSKEDIASMIGFICSKKGDSIRDTVVKMYGNV